MNKDEKSFTIAVFCRYGADFMELNAFPRNAFKRIRLENDLRGIKFTGVIHLPGWDRGEKGILQAHGLLRTIQPELFSND